MSLAEPTADPEIDASRLRWHIAPGWRNRLQADELRPADWIRAGHATVVKHGDHRTVYRVDLPQGRFYLKRYYSLNPLKALVDRLRGSASQREWRKALALATRGISAVRPVALGEFVGTGGSLFLSEELPGASSLAELLARSPAAPPLSADGRQKLCDELARFIAAAHDAGMSHDDLHPGNIMVCLDPTNLHAPVQLTWIDLPGVRIGRRLGWRQSLDSLVMLRASVDGLASPAEIGRFWHAYRAHRADIVPLDGTLVDTIERRAVRYLRRLHHSREKRFFRANREFHNLTASGMRAFAVGDVDRAALHRLAANPEQLLHQHLHKPVKLTRGTQLVEAPLVTAGASLPLAYKRYRSRNVWKLLLDQVRGSRARRAWRAGHALLALGISTPRPIVCCEPTGWANPVSYLGTAWIANAPSLHEVAWELEGCDPVERHRRLCRSAHSLGQLIGRLHHWHYSHRDLKACNLLLVEQDDAVTSYLVDLDSVQRRVYLTQAAAAKNLARLATSLAGYDWITRTHRWRFILGYAQAARLTQQQARWFWQRTDRYAGQSLRRMRRHGKPIW